METGPTCIRVIDLETGGNGPDEVCEIGWQDLRLGMGRVWRLDDERGSLLVNPGRPMSPETIAVLRRIARFGTAIKMKGCADIASILAETKWEGSPKRTVTLEFHHVEAIIAKAHEMGRPSLALGTALQWETLLRQRDVIGEWEPYDAEAKPAGWTINGRLWVNGLEWESIGADWKMSKRTTKTGAVVVFDLTALPLALAELQRVKLADRKGPVIIDEVAGRPYAENRYQQEWRKVADAAGVPRAVKNMDARSGGATEADEAGAARSDIQLGMAHSDPKTTSRYVRGNALEQGRRMAAQRQALRARKVP